MSKKTLYEGMKEDLLTVTYLKENGETERVRHVALWRNQIAREKLEIPFQYPAIFIEFLPTNYMEHSSQTYQSVELMVRLHLCFQSKKNEDLDIFTFAQEVYTKMQLKQYGYFGVLKRRYEEQDFDHTNIQDFIQDYAVGQGKDFGADARPTTEATIENIIITPEITNDLE